jgi:predicted GIY-YIG superfamily endonuclease
MVHWVYVLECEDDYIYVGETTRLFSRFQEHITHRGGKNTLSHTPQKLIGLYKVNDNDSFMEYRNAVRKGEYNKYILDRWKNPDPESGGDNLCIENHITERFFYERRENTDYGGGDEWYKVRGGKYTKSNLDETVNMYKWASEQGGRTYFAPNPTDCLNKEDIVDRPLCKCWFPSEVKLSKDSKVYFVCARKNIWDEFSSQIPFDQPCNFWQMYTEDDQVKRNMPTILTRSRESWIQNIPLSQYKMYPEPCVSCNREHYLAIINNGYRRCCQSCLYTKYDELKGKYQVPLFKS